MFFATNMAKLSEDGKWEVRYGKKRVVVSIVPVVPTEEDSD